MSATVVDADDGRQSVIDRVNRVNRADSEDDACASGIRAQVVAHIDAMQQPARKRRSGFTDVPGSGSGALRRHRVRVVRARGDRQEDEDEAEEEEEDEEDEEDGAGAGAGASGEQDGGVAAERENQARVVVPANITKAMRLYASKIAGIKADAKELARKRKPVAEALKAIKTFMLKESVPILRAGKTVFHRKVHQRFKCDPKRFETSDDIPTDIKNRFIETNTVDEASVQVK